MAKKASVAPPHDNSQSAARESEASWSWMRPTTYAQMRSAATAAISMCDTIRDWLPLVGEENLKANIHTIDQWFERAADYYTDYERIRNPQQSPWPGPKGSFVMQGPKTAFTYWQELSYAMEAICLHYDWQGISDASGRNLSSVRNGRQIPPIDNAELKKVEKAAEGILSAAPGGAEDVTGWLTVSDAAKISAIDKTKISKAVTEGKIKGNGKSGPQRLIDPVDFARWQLEDYNRQMAAE